jgi:hypothetical protein
MAVPLSWAAPVGLEEHGFFTWHAVQLCSDSGTVCFQPSAAAVVRGAVDARVTEVPALHVPQHSQSPGAVAYGALLNPQCNHYGNRHSRNRH